jgi:hypothetical protein
MFVKLIANSGNHRTLFDCRHVSFVRKVDGRGTVEIFSSGDKESVSWRMDWGDRAYAMNNEGRTVDSFEIPGQVEAAGHGVSMGDVGK